MVTLKKGSSRKLDQNLKPEFDSESTALSDGKTSVHVYSSSAIWPGCCLLYTEDWELLFAGPIPVQPSSFPNEARWVLNPKDYLSFRDHQRQYPVDETVYEEVSVN